MYRKWMYFTAKRLRYTMFNKYNDKHHDPLAQRVDKEIDNCAGY